MLSGRVRGLIAILALTVGLAGTVGCAPAAAAQVAPIGAHSMLQLDDPASFMQTMFAEAARMNASAIRLDVAPSLVFTDPSAPPDFSGLDEVMSLSLQYHLDVVAVLATIPWWIADCPAPADLTDMTRCGTDETAAYGSLIAEIVSHADPVIHEWEIWNEPDSGEFFTGTPQQYAGMLRAAHDAIKGVDPGAEVLLGGVSGSSAIGWLAQVFATPGADAAQAFDIGSLHERNRLDALAGDVMSFRWFLAENGFTGPLWVTEHGYPSDPAYQYDPSFAAGLASQAAYLTASIPTLLDAGAAMVFVTERDNLSGQFASEGVLGGDVSDPPVADPGVIEKPSYDAVQALAACYTALGRDCLGPPPLASPTTVTVPATPPGATSTSAVTVSDPGSEPLALDAATLEGDGSGSLQIPGDGCASQILEPDETCTITLRFAPSTGGAVAGTLLVDSEDGALSVAVTAVAPSVASLTWPPSAGMAFAPTGKADGVADPQRLRLALANPLAAAVHITAATVSGAEAPRFVVQSDTCSGTIGPQAACAVSVVFTPTRVGTAHALLTLRGDGDPLAIPLRATAYAPPAITDLAYAGGGVCRTRGSSDQVLVRVDQPSSLTWSVRREGPPGARCRPAVGPGNPVGAPGRRLSPGRTSATGRGSTGAREIVIHHRTRFEAVVGLPLGLGPRGLVPGSYLMIVTAANAHGTGQPAAMSVQVVAA